MAAPKVRTLDQLLKESNPGYDPQRASINTQIQAANNATAAQEQGLEAAKTNAFNDITQTAVRRGALFSGFTPDQQARYTSEKYLPALANLRATTQQTIQGLNDQLYGLNSQQYKEAQATRQGDLDKLYNYNQTQDDRRWQTQQAKVAYDRELNKLRVQADLDRRNQVAAAAASVRKPTTADYAASMQAKLQQLWGADNYISPTVWAQQKAAWIGQGQSAKDFDKLFSGYKNPNNPWYK